MKNKRQLMSGITMAAVVFLLTGAITQAEDNLTDPYEIYEKQYEAIGGFEKVKAESTSYVETEISIGGLNGTVKSWNKSPIYSRQDVDLKILKQSSGDNGQYMWSADTNGKVQIHKDEDILKRREISKLTAEYEHLDRNSTNFKLIFDGTEKVGEVDCYAVKTLNNINDDSSITYFNKSSFLMEKSISFTPDAESHTMFSDYREVNGILRSFHQENTVLPVNQKVSIQITKIETNIAIDLALFEPPGDDVNDYRFTEGNSVEDVPFEYIMNHIFLKVNVGCKERLWILDSGAGMSVIDSSFAVELGLKVDGDLKAQGAGNTVAFSIVKLPPFSMIGIEFDEQTIGSINLQALLQMAGMDAAGILGYDFMSRFVIKVDYAKKLISFYDPKEFKYTGDGKVIEAPLKGNIFSVPATVDGEYTGRWRLDLGATGNSFHYPFAKANGLTERKGIDGLSWGAGGEIRDKRIQFNTIEMAGFTVQEPLVDIPIGDVDGGFGEGELIGNIGNSFLRHFTIYLDYERQQMIVEKGDDFDRKFPKNKSGLQIMFDKDNNYEVMFVAENTPSSNAGFKKGDIVLAINDIDIESFKGLEAVGKLWRAEAGIKYKVTVQRDGKQTDLNLKLEDIY